jgi:hypothetical protein
LPADGVHVQSMICALCDLAAASLPAIIVIPAGIVFTDDADAAGARQ